MSTPLLQLTETEIETQSAEEFAGRMLEILNDAALALMTSVGHRVGLFDALAAMPPSSSEAIAQGAGLHERYVREWLAAMVTGGIVDYDPAEQTYVLPAYRAASLTHAAGAENFARTAQFIPLLGAVEEPIVRCFRHGGGVAYDSYPRFHALMAEESASVHDAALIERILPLVPGLVDRLTAGIDALDLGCGRGHAVNLMARAFPKSHFTGLDAEEDAIEAGRAEAQNWGLHNVRHEVCDAAEIDRPTSYDLVTAFDAIHDLVAPAAVLKNVVEALRSGGTFLMVDFAASSHLENNLDHFLATFLYTISCMHCTSVSLAGGGTALGTMWGEEKARQMLREAGFADVAVERLEDDPVNHYYIAVKRG
jgi:SAM-dependent methyltransferase